MNHLLKLMFIASLVSTASAFVSSPTSRISSLSRAADVNVNICARFIDGGSSEEWKGSILSRPLSSTGRPGTALNIAQWVQDSDLFVGQFAAFMGASPYMLQVLFPEPLNKYFFLPEYIDSTDGRAAEIKWKSRYATLAFVVTFLHFADYNGLVGTEPNAALRLTYLAWTIFYTDATLLIFKQARTEPPTFTGKSRLLIQAWHITVAALLWASASETYTGHAIVNFVRNVNGLESVLFSSVS